MRLINNAHDTNLTFSKKLWKRTEKWAKKEWKSCCTKLNIEKRTKNEMKYFNENYFGWNTPHNNTLRRYITLFHGRELAWTKNARNNIHKMINYLAFINNREINYSFDIFCLYGWVLLLCLRLLLTWSSVAFCSFFSLFHIRLNIFFFVLFSFLDFSKIKI